MVLWRKGRRAVVNLIIPVATDGLVICYGLAVERVINKRFTIGVSITV